MGYFEETPCSTITSTGEHLTTEESRQELMLTQELLNNLVLSMERRREATIASPDNAHSTAFSQRSSSPHLIEDETCNASHIINNLITYEDGRELDSLRSDKNMQRSSFLTNWKSIFLK
ncbi:uncharacterized protein TNCV_2719681 [Trichonephila clavipes]|nr:uncharacterized protein TNCV_2719681 [Trichonephila clavipes]